LLLYSACVIILNGFRISVCSIFAVEQRGIKVLYPKSDEEERYNRLFEPQDSYHREWLIIIAWTLTVLALFGVAIFVVQGGWMYIVAALAMADVVALVRWYQNQGFPEF
jgi:hypothetical protein